MDMLNYVLFVAIIGVIYANYNYNTVLKIPEGNTTMADIATKIRIGAQTFLAQEYGVLWKVVVIVATIFALFIQIISAFSFVLGIFISGLAGYVGMMASSRANVRVTNMARISRNLFTTLKVALCGGSIMGVSVPSFTLIGIYVTITMFAITNYTDIASTTLVKMIGFDLGYTIDSFLTNLFTFGLGCSVMALFNRVAGGIFTKAADMAADLVGKSEMGLSEDDPMNPAVIADAVGDNVGDTAGLGADLLESFAGSIISCISLVIILQGRLNALGYEVNEAVLEKLKIYPVLFVTIGLLACIFTLVYFFCSKSDDCDAEGELNKASTISAVLTMIGNFALTNEMFAGEDVSALSFSFGIYSPFIAASIGVVTGILFGQITKYYTSNKNMPTQKVATRAAEGDAMLLAQGFSTGMKSVFYILIVLGVSTELSYLVAGYYGVTIAAVGMLSFIGIMVSIDTYGPISDNAGGISEMAQLPKDVRQITDELDSVGNTTAAIGKGFSIGSAALTTISLMVSYIYSITPLDEEAILNVINPLVLFGTFVGSGISYHFSDILMDAVSDTADKAVIEVRKQFSEMKQGKRKNPDYVQTIEIVTNGALSAMKEPTILAILIPIIGGFVFGSQFVLGLLFGAIITSIALAVFFGNTGGCWDNAKKFIEKIGMEKGEEYKKSMEYIEQHRASITGDTLGDPLKDTLGPSMNILIKIMCMTSLIMVPIYHYYNLLQFITK